MSMSSSRQSFHTAILAKKDDDALNMLNGLSMDEMLPALAAIGTDNRTRLAAAMLGNLGKLNIPRMIYALQVVNDLVVPNAAPGDLEATGQVQTARDFVKEPKPFTASNVDPNTAARAMLTAINPFSIRQNREYWGWILKQGQLFTATTPTRSRDETGADPTDPTLPPGTSRFALYHTHAAGYTYVNGSTAAEIFSLQDRIVLKNKKVSGYLATPSGSLLRLSNPLAPSKLPFLDGAALPFR